MKNRSLYILLAMLPMIVMFTMGMDGCEGEPSDYIENPDDVNEWWDTDCDGISTPTELNNANAYLNLDTATYDWAYPTACGEPCRYCSPGVLECGWIDSAMNLVNQGLGYYHYLGTDPMDTDDWGTLELINMIEMAGRDWRSDNYSPPRIGVGDLSRGNLATLTFGGNWDHNCHQNGLEADFRYVRNDGQDLPLNLAGPDSIHYDGVATVTLMNDYLDEYGDITLIILDTLYSGITGPDVHHDTSHRDHFHVRIEDPDGPDN